MGKYQNRFDLGLLLKVKLTNLETSRQLMHSSPSSIVPTFLGSKGARGCGSSTNAATPLNLTRILVTPSSIVAKLNMVGKSATVVGG